MSFCLETLLSDMHDPERMEDISRNDDVRCLRELLMRPPVPVPVAQPVQEVAHA